MAAAGGQDALLLALINGRLDQTTDEPEARTSDTITGPKSEYFVLVKTSYHFLCDYPDEPLRKRAFLIINPRRYRIFDVPTEVNNEFDKSLVAE